MCAKADPPNFISMAHMAPAMERAIKRDAPNAAMALYDSFSKRSIDFKPSPPSVISLKVFAA